MKRRFGKTLIAGVQIATLSLLTVTAPLAHFHKEDPEDPIGFHHAITVHTHLDGLLHRSSQRSADPSSRSQSHEESVHFSRDVMVPPLVSQLSGLRLTLVAPVVALQRPSRTLVSMSLDGCKVNHSPPIFRKPARAPPSAC